MKDAQADPATEHFDRAEFAAAAGYVTVIDFDSLTPGDGVLHSDEFAAHGLTIVNYAGQPAGPINAR